MEKLNYMVVTVKYTHRSFTLSSGRFTYEDFDGTKHLDKKTFVKNGEAVKERAIKYLEQERGMNVVATDDTYKDITYIIVAPGDDGFNSVSGKFEKEKEELV
jgi:hypothetical protein